MRILLLTPFLLGNSAGGLGALVGLVGIILAIAAGIGIIWGLIKWLS